MESLKVNYRNIQGLRAIAALMVFASHMFWDILPMRTHWAKPFIVPIGPSGVDIFFVISGFIIYNVAQRSAAQVDTAGRGRAVYEFVMKRIIRIYPLYWLAFGTAALIMIWVPLPASFERKPQWALFFLINGIPNFRVPVAWTLTFEVYFYAVTALSLFLFPKKILTGLLGWFAIIGLAVVIGTVFDLSMLLKYACAPILLEFLLGVVIAVLIERGQSRYYAASLCLGAIGMLGGAVELHHHEGWAAQSNVLRLACWGFPAALIVYGTLALEVRKAWIMPKALQYLGDASYSLYLWHAIVFTGVAAVIAHLGWTGSVDRTLLATLMGMIGFGAGLLSYHFLEKPSLRLLGQVFTGRGVRVAADSAPGLLRPSSCDR
ncbi:acyltransferase family protein [Dyella choica]|uniref:Acyltransferase n=1 Tax=Dyella choica TaxID=1927959 RepID=A0A432LZD3_9GAMM|nr:acyltransferase [Dyella choica]RUL69003.1 acyltransferase [Dyella choica]